MIVLLVIWLLFGFATMAVMQNKGRDGCGGFALGFLLGPFGLIIALVVSTDHREMEKKSSDPATRENAPIAPRLIRREASRCRYCGSDIPPVDYDSRSGDTKG